MKLYCLHYCKSSIMQTCIKQLSLKTYPSTSWHPQAEAQPLHESQLQYCRSLLSFISDEPVQRFQKWKSNCYPIVGGVWDRSYGFHFNTSKWFTLWKIATGKGLTLRQKPQEKSQGNTYDKGYSQTLEKRITFKSYTSFNTYFPISTVQVFCVYACFYRLSSLQPNFQKLQ